MYIIRINTELFPFPIQASDEELLDESVHLERGQNLFEIHVKRVSLKIFSVNIFGTNFRTVEEKSTAR